MIESPEDERQASEDETLAGEENPLAADDAAVAEWEAMLEDEESGGETASEGEGASVKGAKNGGGRVPAVHDVEIDAYAILGTSAMPVSQLLRMGRGAVVELDTGLGDQIDIKVNDVLVARGEIVVVQDRVAIEITEVIKRDQD